ncbi:DUF58 domain-containing protein [Micromonospora sp. NPDC049559]|uniref:DUF58 domain-containing protein n=1 Tax=Micromonospora sp. NPDC049559 TaxID=3155923 RepID=UPI0034487C53
MDRDPTLRELAPEHRLRRLELAVTRRLDGLLHGQYQGLLPGSGSEFAGSREYRPGEDEVRRMDWAVTARTALPHVREVDADRELSTWLLVDATASMDFGTAELEKRELAVAAVAAVGFLTAGAGNRLGAYLLGGDGVRRFPARGGRQHLLSLLRALMAAPRGGTAGTAPARATGPMPAAARASGRMPTAGPAPMPASAPALADALDALRRAVARRGLVVVVSDFLDGLPERETGIPAWEVPLRRLAARHQVLAVEVTDPREWELPDVGVITLVDPESGRRREVDSGDARLRQRYAEAAAAQREAVRRSLRRAGANHLPLRTDRDWTADIVRHVHAQRRLAGANRSRQPVHVGGGGGT